jgi:hypothetical protein
MEISNNNIAATPVSAILLKAKFIDLINSISRLMVIPVENTLSTILSRKPFLKSKEIPSYSSLPEISVVSVSAFSELINIFLISEGFIIL